MIVKRLLKQTGFITLFFMAVISCVPPLSNERDYRTQHPKLSYLKRYAESFLGTPYKYGGSGRDGMDCSGLVVRVYADVLDKKLPHNTSQLYYIGESILPSQLYAGDLVFFGEGGYRVTHVGIFLDGNRFIHASVSRGVVVSTLNSPYYKKRFIGARRIL